MTLTNEQDALRRDRDALQNELEAAGAEFKGRECRCIFCKEQNPSAGIFEGADRAWRYKCHSCDFSGDIFDVRAKLNKTTVGEELKAALGHGAAKLKINTRKKTTKKPKVHATKEKAVAAVKWGVAKSTGCSETDITVEVQDFPDGCAEVRCILPKVDPKTDKKLKEVRRISKRPDGWVCKQPAGKLPLYNRDGLKGGIVYWPEGARKAALLIRLGIVATATFGGANGFKSSDLRPLTGVDMLVMLPDNDAPSKAFAEAAAGTVLAMNRLVKVKILNLPDLGPKEDIVQFCEKRQAAGKTDDEIKQEIEALADAAPLYTPAPADQDGEVDAGVPDDGGDGDEDDRTKRSQATMMVEMAQESGAALFHDDDAAYASIRHEDGHVENHALNRKVFKLWLAKLFYNKVEKAPGSQALTDAVNTLSGHALFGGPQINVAVRVAENEGAIYLDLADEKWQVVKITVEGWELIPMADCPVKFIRRRGMQALPSPVRGGSVDEMRRFINVKENRDFILIVAWLVATLRGRGPYPVQAVYGEHGTCKSTAQKIQRSLVDPNKSLLRAEPKEPRDLMIAASNSLVVGFDNLSSIPTWLSDALCRLSTGGGFSTRELYSDGEEMIFDAMGPVMFNGITDVATRPDLLDRGLHITLALITDSERRPEDELWADFYKVRPRILGALLDAVAVGLANINRVSFDRLPRMADFAKWVLACEAGLGWKPGTFMEAYLGNRATANESAIEGSEIGMLIVKLIEERSCFNGTVKELKEAVEGLLPQDRNGAPKMPKEWPKSSKGFSGELRRIAPNLRAAGTNITFGKHTRKGTPVVLEQVGKTPSPPSPSSQPLQDKDLRGDGQGDGRGGAVVQLSHGGEDCEGQPCPGDGQGDSVVQASHPPSPHKSSNDKGYDSGDGGDGENPTSSDGAVVAREETLL